MEKKIVWRIMLTLLLLSMFALTFNVQPVKSEPRIIWVPDDYPTIQGAVDAAADGDTIRVRTGVYTENVLIISKSISLIGDDASNTTIRGVYKSG